MVEHLRVYCVGCGELVTRLWDDVGDDDSVICDGCGAVAPFIVTEDGHGRVPFDLLALIRAHIFAVLEPEEYPSPYPLPHLEFFFGFSDFTSALKSALQDELRLWGHISMAECGSPGCVLAFEAEKAKYVRRDRLKQIGEV